MNFMFLISFFTVQTTCNECIEILASICETTSLASLSLYFPPQRIWQCEVLNVSELSFQRILRGDRISKFFFVMLIFN